MNARAFFRRTLSVVLAALVALVLVPARAQAFAPKDHLDAILGRLGAAGFSEGEVWLLAYFSIEVDMAAESPDWSCSFPIRWPTGGYVCKAGLGKGDYDPCAGEGNFEDFANWCVPFHNCRTSYSAKDSTGAIEGWQARAVRGPAAFARMWSVPSVEDGLHLKPGERCYDSLKKFGYMLHGIQDFYAHTNWVEVFHQDLGFDLDKVPTWTSFQKAQRGKLNLILLEHTGNEADAIALYDDLDSLRLGGTGWHDMYKKDSDDIDVYTPENIAYHREDDGHTILDYHKVARNLAATETYLMGLQFKANILNNPELGQAAWNRLFKCVSEMAAYDGVSYKQELGTYQGGIARLAFYSANMRELCATVIAPVAAPVAGFFASLFAGPLGFLIAGPQAAAFCALVPNQAWH